MGFTRFTKNVLNISSLPDRVQNQSTALKRLFDQSGVDIKEALNFLMSELESNMAANNIGADIGSVATKTVQAILTAFEAEIANRYTKAETDTKVLTDTNNLIEDFDINLTTGVITITKKDGTTETFDTAIEKVPAKFEIVESGTAVFLKITNVDGTSTQTDITELMNVYEFVNTDDISFTMTGTGNEKKVTANIRNNSIGIEKFSLSVISQFEGYVTSASNSAKEAKGYADSAKSSKEQAAKSATESTNQANNARGSATSASNSANTAIEKANESAQSASLANAKTKEAESYTHGGTGIREGEDTDNARYYSEIAKKVAGGDFVTTVEMEKYAQKKGTTPTFETTELSGQEIEVDAPLDIESVLQLSGNSEQDSRSGKNKLKPIDNKTINGVTLTNNSDGTFDLVGTASADAYFIFTTTDILISGSTYTLSKNISDFGVSIYEYNGNTWVQTVANMSKTELSKTFTYAKNSSATRSALQLNITSGTTLSLKNIKLQLEKGSIATPYEAYGVQPSPDYPSEIRSVKSKSDNLLTNVATETLTTNGITFTVNEDKSFTLNGTATAKAVFIFAPDERDKLDKLDAGSYMISLGEQAKTGVAIGAKLDASDGTTKYIYTGSKTKWDLDKEYSLTRSYLDVESGTTLSNFVVKPMLNKGDKALPYQPYGYVPAKVKAEGKNLVDFTNGTPSSINNTYTFTNDVLTFGGTGTWFYVTFNISDIIQNNVGKTLRFYYEDYDFSNGENPMINLIYATGGENKYHKLMGTNGAVADFTIPDNLTKLLLQVLSNNTSTNKTTSISITKPMLYFTEAGEVTSYEPYVEPQIIPVPLGDIELRSTPDGTRDTFERVDGVWNVVGKAPSVIFDGSDDEGWYVISLNDKTVRADAEALINAKGINQNKCLCSRFTMAYEDNSDYEHARNGSKGYPTTFVMYINKDRIGNPTTKEEALIGVKTYLANNPMEVQYPLATPTYTPITDTALISALDELEQLILHKGYNRITATSVNGVKAELNLFIPSTASVTEVVETESSMDMPVLLAVGDGDVKPKIAGENRMTFNPTTGEAKVNGEKVATIQNLSAVINTTGWSGEKPYYIDIPVQGLKATDKPHYGLSYSTVGVTAADKTIRENEQLAFNDITAMVANDNSLRVICDNRIPLTEMTVQLEVVR